MFRTPTHEDLERNLADITRRFRDQASAEAVRLTSQFAARGTAQSTTLIGAVSGRVGELHDAAITEGMHVLRDFIARGVFSSAEIGAVARPQLESCAAALLGVIPSAGFPQVQNKIRDDQRRAFSDRLDGALRDIEVGFIGGRNVAPTRDTDLRAAVLRKLYDERHRKSFVELHDLAAAAGIRTDHIATAINICEQLFDAGLIVWKTPGVGTAAGMAKITGSGVDVIEGTAKAPISITIDRSVTVNNSAHVQAGQFGDHATIEGTSSVTINHIAGEINKLLDQIERQRASLPQEVRDKIEPVIAELRAATKEAQPNPSRLQRGIERLKTVLEIAAGDIVAAGALHLLAHLPQIPSIGG